jgi:hypothetical protein
MTPSYNRASSPASGNPPACASAGAQTSSASLGTYYEITVPPPSVEAIQWRLRRYHLQSIAREILPDFGVFYCLRSLIPRMEEVDVFRSGDRARYGNLQCCGSPWVCPVDAARIAEHRRQEIVAGNREWKNQNGVILHVAMTTPHRANQPLKELLEKFTHARQIMRNRKRWRTWKRDTGLVGTLRGLEVTWGPANGWHVHTHEGYYLDREVYPYEVQANLWLQWKAACKTAGLEEPSFNRGVRVQDGTFAAGYWAKWGIESEIAKSHIKRARNDNYGPFDMLLQVDQGKDDFRRLFREYGKAFKGKRQLVWSDGLRKILGLGTEKSDEELAGSKLSDDEKLLGKLDRFTWQRVLHREKRGELLEAAARGGWQGVIEFLADLF